MNDDVVLFVVRAQTTFIVDIVLFARLQKEIEVELSSEETENIENQVKSLNNIGGIYYIRQRIPFGCKFTNYVRELE